MARKNILINSGAAGVREVAENGLNSNFAELYARSGYENILSDTTLAYQTEANPSGSVVAGDILGPWEVAASDESDHHATTAGGVKLYEAGPSFSTRARAVAAHARNIAAGRTVPDGTVWTWPDAAIRYDGVSTSVADFSGWAEEFFGAGGRVMNEASAKTLDDLPDGEIVWVTDKFGGSWWRAKDTAEVVDGVAGTAYTFVDEMTFYRTTSGKPFIFDIDLNADLLRSLEREQYIDFFAKQNRRDTAQHVAVYGDSLTFGQAGASASGASNLIGTATDYGDGSSHANWQYDQNIPVELEDGLADVRASTLTVHNRGYSGDRAWQMYNRHRTPPTAGVSIVWASGTNEVGNATSNAATTPGITTDADDGVAGYTEALRRFVAREILRGNSVVVMGSINYSGSTGWDGYSSSAMRLASAYNSAAKTVAGFFGVQFVDVRKEILDQYYIGDIQADSLHFNPTGCKVIGRRLAALFVGDGWRSIDKVQGGSVIVANPATANILSQALTPVTVNVSPQSGAPGLISANPTTLNVVAGDPIMLSFYSEVEDLVCYVNGKAIDATVTIDLDGAALQQDYQSAISSGKTTQPSGTAPVSTRTEAYSGTHLINRVAKRWSSDDGLWFHVSGKGWHTVTITKDSGTTVQFDGLEFQAWENERQPREELIMRTADATAIQSDTTFTADDVLTFDMVANEVVNVEGFIRYSSGATPGFKWYLLGPTFWDAYGIKGGTDPRDETSLKVTVTETGSANNRAFKFNATVTTGANAGTISFMWAQSTSDASDTKVLAGSYLKVKRK